MGQPDECLADLLELGPEILQQPEVPFPFEGVRADVSRVLTDRRQLTHRLRLLLLGHALVFQAGDETRQSRPFDLEQSTDSAVVQRRPRG